MDTETVVRLRAKTRVDRYSQKPVADWSQAPDELELETLAPAQPMKLKPFMSEPTDARRDELIDGWLLYLSPGADITTTDRVRIRGIDHDVTGMLADWLAAGTVVQATRTEG